MNRSVFLGLLPWLALARPPLAAEPAKPAIVDFNRQILPLLADNCFAFHGPDEKQRRVKLRLDTE